MINYIGFTFTTLGALFIFLAVLSVLRFHDFYSRLNAFVKFAAFGTFCLMLGVLIFCGFSAVGIKAILCIAVVVLTLPAEAQLLMRSARKTGIKMPGELDSQDQGKGFK